MPQTRFVLKQALKMGLKIIVVINKIDRPDARIEYVVNKTFDLFIELGADEESAYFPTIYASAKKGLAGEEKNLENMTDIIPIFEAILKHIPEPGGDETKPLQMLVTSVTSDNFKGRVATGRIFEGRLNKNQDVIHISREGNKSKCRLTSLMSFVGLEKQEENEAVAGDIVAISGIPNITIGETITDNMDTSALPLLSIEEPTVKMTFGVNTSTFAGKEGEFKTSRQIEERLMKAAEDDVALKVENASGGWVVSGRGELHLTILIERLRREGFEFQVSRPVVITKELFGYRSEFITDTKGMGILNTNFLEFGQNLEKGFERDNGSLVVHENGVTKLYALIGAQGRGTLFIGPGISVYKGQVIGMNSRSEDISENVCKEKSQTNHRSSGEGTSEHFNSPKFMSLEEAVEYINDAELVEITPKNIRIRKANLT